MNSIEPVDSRITTLPHSGQGANAQHAGTQGSAPEPRIVPAPLSDSMSFHHAAEGRLPQDALAALSRLARALDQPALPGGAPSTTVALPAHQTEQAAQALQDLLQSEIAQRQPGQWVQALNEWAAAQIGAQGESGTAGSMTQLLQSVLNDLFQANLAGPSTPPVLEEAPVPQGAPSSTQDNATSTAPPATNNLPAATSDPSTLPAAAKESPASPASNPATPTQMPTPTAHGSPGEASHPASQAAIARLQALVDMARVQNALTSRPASGMAASLEQPPVPGGAPIPVATAQVDAGRAAMLLKEKLPLPSATPNAPEAAAPGKPAPAQTTHAVPSEKALVPQPNNRLSTETQGRDAAPTPAREFQTAVAPASTVEAAPSREAANAKLEALGFRVPDAAEAQAAAKDAVRPPQQSYLWETIVPVDLNKATVPARLRLEWQEPPRDGEGDEANARKQAKPSVLSLAIETEALGRMSFHLAWMAREVAGTVWIERPEVADAAEGEMGHLHRRLQQAGVPSPSLQIRKGLEDRLPGDEELDQPWTEARSS